MARRLDPARLPPPVAFDPATREVVASALDTAKSWGHPSLTTAHLLAGIIRHAPDLVSPLAGRADLVRRELEEAGVSPGSVPEPIPYTGRTKRVLALARRRAFADGERTVDPEGLLTAIVEDGSPIAAKLLARREHRPSEKPPPHLPEDGSDFDWLELSDASSSPYYVQLKEEVERAVASGLLLPGQKLPSVRRMAQHADLAPGTVARAYRLLEQHGVVETAGARGTTITTRLAARGSSTERQRELAALLRPVAVTAFHLGADADDCRAALEAVLPEVFGPPPSDPET